MRYEQSFFFFSSFKKVTAYVEKVLKTVKYNEIGPVPWRQGDQIGRIFAYWAVFLKITEGAQIFGQLFFHGKSYA
jgi:hypothetical protein